MEERRPCQTHRSPHFHNSRFLTHHFPIQIWWDSFVLAELFGIFRQILCFSSSPYRRPSTLSAIKLPATNPLPTSDTQHRSCALCSQQVPRLSFSLSLSLKIPLPPSSIFSMDTLLWQRPQAGQISNSRPGNGSVVTVSLPSSP